MYIGNKEFKLDNNQVYIMGILNVTPDSFSDGNKYNTIDKALKRVEQMINEGVDIIDVGGESTRPGYIPVSDEEEIERVAHVIEKIKKEYDISVSVDTYKTKVAKAAFMAGADMLNDIWGLLYKKDEFNDECMAKIVKEYDVSVCLMHNDENVMSENNMDIVIDRLKVSVDEARKYGIDEDKIMIDPGIGFAKSYENNLYVMKHMNELKVLNKPILLGISNKSMIGNAIGKDVNNRIAGNIAGALYGIEHGARFLRVHDVAAHVDAINMYKAIMNI